MLVSIERCRASATRFEAGWFASLAEKCRDHTAYPANVPRDRVERSSSRFQRDACTKQAVWARASTWSARIRRRHLFACQSSRLRRVAVSAVSVCSGTFDSRAVQSTFAFGVKDSNPRPSGQSRSVLPLDEPRVSAAGGTRTPNRSGKSRMLLPVELRRREDACRRAFELHARLQKHSLRWRESNPRMPLRRTDLQSAGLTVAPTPR